MLLAFLFALLGISIIALVLALYSLYSLIRDRVPYVSTSTWAIEWLCRNLKPATGAVVYDLGCGDARVITALKRAFPAIRAIGVERNWWPYLLARLKTRGTGVIVKRTNFYAEHLAAADIVFCFLIHSVMPKVEKFLRAQLKPGATVYSYGFSFPTWQPVKRIENPERPHGSTIQIYRQ